MKIIPFNILFLVFGIFGFLSITSIAYSFDKFDISKKKCIKIGHKVGSRPYSECIIMALKGQRFREPDTKKLSEIKNYIDEGNEEYWTAAPGQIVVQSVIAVGTSLAVEGMVKSLAPRPAPPPPTYGISHSGEYVRPLPNGMWTNSSGTLFQAGSIPFKY
jgi:hypothetical protein